MMRSFILALGLIGVTSGIPPAWAQEPSPKPSSTTAAVEDKRPADKAELPEAKSEKPGTPAASPEQITDKDNATSAPETSEPPSEATVESDEEPLIAEEIRHRLRQTVTFKCEGASLVEMLVNRIARPAKIDIYFDLESIRAASINVDDVVVTGDFKRTTIRSVLNRVLSPSKLAFVCDDTGIRITSQEAHDQRLFARVYDVSELIPPSEEAGNNAPRGTSALQQTPFGSATPAKTVQFGSGGGGTGGVGFGATLFGPANPPNWNSPLTPNSLQIAIEQATGGDSGSWVTTGGSGTVSILNTGRAKLMVVRQTESIHAEIEDLLADLHSHHNTIEIGEPGKDGARGKDGGSGEDGAQGASAPSKNAGLKGPTPSAGLKTQFGLKAQGHTVHIVRRTKK